MPTTCFDNPFLPADVRWAGVVILIAVGLLLASAVIGVAVRFMGDVPDPDDLKSDDDHPGATATQRPR